LIRADTASITKGDFGENIDAVSLSVTVDPDTAAGVYTIYALGRDGSRAAIIGAIVVSK
jgi:hypothetical protein